MGLFEIRTTDRRTLVDITAQVAAARAEAGLEAGALLVQAPHTTAAVTVNEGFDPDVATDLIAALGALVPRVPFAHGEGNSDAHLLAALVGSAVLVPVEAGALALGRWQRVFFCEFDGPRHRQVRVVPVAAAPGA